MSFAIPLIHPKRMQENQQSQKNQRRKQPMTAPKNCDKLTIAASDKIVIYSHFNGEGRGLPTDRHCGNGWQNVDVVNAVDQIEAKKTDIYTTILTLG